MSVGWGEAGDVFGVVVNDILLQLRGLGIELDFLFSDLFLGIL